MQNTIERKTLILAIIYAITLISVLGLTLYVAKPKKGDIIRIDCRLSEISPDMPIWAKEECRKARMEKLTGNLNNSIIYTVNGI